MLWCASCGRACRPRRRARNALKTIHIADRDEWRAWLQRHGAGTDEIWLVYYKGAPVKRSVPFEEAIEEALCFGWIDSTIKKIDERRYARKFTPRKASSKWAASNVARVRELIRAGKMTAAGMAAFEGYQSRNVPPHPGALPEQLERAFKTSKTAWRNFQAFPPAYRRTTIGWVASAKRTETQLKRLSILIAASDRNERIKFM